MKTREDELPRVLGSNAERDRAVRQLGRELERLDPAERLSTDQLLGLALDDRVGALLAQAPENANAMPLQPGERVRSAARGSPEWEREQAAVERSRRLHDAGVQDAITEQDLESLVRDGVPAEPSDALRRVRGWQRERRQGRADFGVLVLLGLKGRGKTFAGAWLLAHYGPGLYCTAEQLRASFKATFGHERELYRRAQQARVLHIDEVGRELDAESADAAMFDVINCRRGLAGFAAHEATVGLKYQRWTLITGNLTQEEFRARYDESTIDRIEQQGAIRVASGEDLRVRLIDRIKREKSERGGVK